MITVSEASDVSSFKSYSAPLVAAAATSPAPTLAPPPKPAPEVSSTPASASAPVSSAGATGGNRIFVSPLAAKLAAEKGVDVSTLFPGSGPKGRVIAADIASASASASVPQTKVTVAAAPTVTPASVPDISGLSEGDFVPSPSAAAISTLYTTSKQVRNRTPCSSTYLL